MSRPSPDAGPTLRRADGLVVALRPLDPAAPWIQAWRDLAERVLVDNLFYTPDYALAAAGAFGSGVRVALVGDRPPEAPGLCLLALWPCRRPRARWGLPLPLTMGWMHPFGVFGVPLLDAAEAARALDALLSGLTALSGPRLMLTHVPTAGPFADLLAAWRAGQGGRQAAFWPHERAFLHLAGKDAAARAAYLGHVSGRKRRRLRQWAERMASGRTLAFETIRDRDGLRGAVDDYVALEGRGWKGRAGTAIGGRPAEATFLRAAVAAYAAAGRARIDRFRRDGETLASAITLTTRAQTWCLKISFDEAQARNSPGALLIHRLTESLLADPALTSADSCAPPGSPIVETLWTERLALAHLLVEGPGGDPLFPLAVRLERLRAGVSRLRQGRRAAKPE
ncbi:GNAT family N-acetyltransferase [Methylobacterium iners]|uniref:BioF2-like acetyltransferase domain-containing protein n=1 Tax=Methylobacterium iners TaxID=418707 RepID=A0ABQ4RYQ8_9HYPH|nr:GNAT family N-acetyltransferase [Methylobacterium iners]GJD94829.1 hypothetical protein OCOJLMKI_2035 [Methylobacterium iners]